AILAFMAIYYLWLGVISDICLVINLILLIGTMAFIDATFTLPGLAGVVLTMGMAVDANVLIYERMREELERGASLRMSIQNGFSRAFSSIFDSNITTLLTAVILYMIGSDQVKGFAVTLFIGLAISMYTALTVNRLMLEIVERKRWLKQFKMMSIFGVTNFDFVGKQLYCAAGSVLLIGAGLAAVALRGENNLDIDFSGGTMVTVEFNEPQNADDVRSKLEQAFHSDITLEQLTSRNDANAHKRFRIRTTDQNDAEVQKVISETFPNQLKRNTMEYSAVAEIPQVADGKEGAVSPQKGDFPGGHVSELTFSSEAATDTMVRYFAASLADVKNDKNEPMFKDPDAAEAFFSIRGDKAEEKKSEAGEMQRYNKMTLRTDASIPEKAVDQSLAQMKQTLANSPEFDEVNNFESSVAAETQRSAILAMVASLIMIVIYIWFRFQNVYFGLAAVLALLHDVLCTLGMVALAAYVSKTPIGPYLLLSDFKINLTMIAAFLTIVGYSLNDTIVIFDRIREIRGKNPSFTRGMVNLAVNQTLSRTILTAGTVFITVVILYAVGGEGIHGFAYAMLIGTVVGCYSTIYVASPFVLYLMEKYQKSSQTPQAAAPVGAART
ncbi:MAG TPA: protein translocase subunit SecF, partial [Planctomycetaceae bacterium]|nr:protein translocase subunit SecF [Planctomycetaceae bacterium]